MPILYSEKFTLSNDVADMKFVLLHEAKNDEGIRSFFMEVWELYVKVSGRRERMATLRCMLGSCGINFD